jgi:hypothetical protein
MQERIYLFVRTLFWLYFTFCGSVPTKCILFIFQKCHININTQSVLWRSWWKIVNGYREQSLVKNSCWCYSSGFHDGNECSLLFISMWWYYVTDMRPPTGLLFAPQIVHEYGEQRWNYTDRENWRTRRKRVPVTLCPPQIPRRVVWVRTRTSAMRGQRLITWTTARPWECSLM